MFFKLLTFAFICIFALEAFFVKKEYGDFQMKIITYAFESNERLNKSVIVNVQGQEYKNGSFTMRVHGIVKKRMGVVGFRIRLLVWNEELRQFILMFNIVVKNICSSQLSKILSFIQGLNKDCTANPGTYDFTVPNLNPLVHTMTNGKFFYGTYRALTDVHAGGRGKFLSANITYNIIKSIHPPVA